MASKKIVSLLLVLTIIASSLITYTAIEFGGDSVAQAKTPDVLGVVVSPDGSSFQLGVNSSKTFTANALNGTAPYVYTWNLAPTGSFDLEVNGQVTALSNATNIDVESQGLTLKFPYAVENEFVILWVQVTDADGLVGKSELIMVADPYTSPGYKFDGSVASAAVVCRPDGKGWFRAYNATTGAVITSLDSIVADTTLDGALALAAGKTVYVDGGAWTGAALTVPAATTLIADPSTTGITYTSIGAGARIDEPAFNTCFGGYSGGSYTIVTGSSAMVSGTANYLALKPDSTISWSSTDAYIPIKNTINTVYSNGGGLVKITEGNFYCSSNIVQKPSVSVEGINEWATNICFLPTVNQSLPLWDFQGGEYYFQGGISYLRQLTIREGGLVLNSNYLKIGGFYNRGEIIKNVVVYNSEPNNNNVGVIVTNCWVDSISGLSVQGQFNTGVYIQGKPQGTEAVNGITFFNLASVGKFYNLKINGDCNNIIFENPNFDDFPAKNFIYIDASTTVDGQSPKNIFVKNANFEANNDATFSAINLTNTGNIAQKVNGFTLTGSSFQSTGSGVLTIDLNNATNTQLISNDVNCNLNINIGSTASDTLIQNMRNRVSSSSVNITDYGNRTTFSSNQHGINILPYGSLSVFNNNVGYAEKSVALPTSNIWGTTLAGSGNVTIGGGKANIHLETGITASSSAKAYVQITGLQLDSIGYTRINWDKRTQIDFDVQRINSDGEFAGYITFKNSATTGVLEEKGVGLAIGNYDLYTNTYGSTQVSGNLASYFSDQQTTHITIVVIPTVGVQFYVNDALKATMTGNALPSGTSDSAYFVISVANGATGGSNSILEIQNIIVTQQQ